MQVKLLKVPVNSFIIELSEMGPEANTCANLILEYTSLRPKVELT